MTDNRDELEQEIEQLHKALQWCAEHFAVPSLPSGDTTICDAGCGCCSAPIHVPPAVADTLRDVFTEELADDR